MMEFLTQIPLNSSFILGGRAFLSNPFLGFSSVSFVIAQGEKIFVRAALVGFGYGRPNLEMLDSNLMSIATGLDTDVPDAVAHVQSGAKYTGGQIPRIRVPAVTLSSVLDRAGAPEVIDLVSLDVEGAELAVLKGIDFRRFSLQWILTESRNIDRIADYLKPHGYTLHTRLDDSNFLFGKAPSP